MKQIINYILFNIQYILKQKQHLIFSKRNPPKPLGRWLTGNSNKEKFYSYYGSIDSCGDNLCGNPKTYNKNDIY